MTVTASTVWDQAVKDELEHQESWGGEGHDDGHDELEWLAILVKQVGHVADRAIREWEGSQSRDEIIQEIVQVAAVATSWGQALIRKELRQSGCP